MFQELARSQLADRQARQAIARALKAKKETAEAKARKANIGLWTHQLEEVRRQERVQLLVLNKYLFYIQQILEEKARPFRQYVATHVMPTLTSGLIECAKVKPADPVDFLAEYLYQHNPALQ